MLRNPLIAVAIAPFLVLSASAAVVTVDLMGGGDFPTIQQGLDAASPGDTVLVLPGTYTGDLNRDLNFHGEGIVLMSSAGATQTVIDCQSAGRGFYFASGEDTTTVVSGFTVLAGAPPGGQVTGAGAEIYSASPKIEDCVFSQNSTQQGGGICVRQADSAPIIRRCAFTGNSGSLGGGIHVASGAVRVRDCTFEDNDAFRGAGAYFSLSSSTLTGCDFVENEAGDRGGAIYADQCPAITITDCNFTDNVSQQIAAGACFYQGAATVTGCSFSGNAAGNSGGGMSATGCALSVGQCGFESNTASAGGGLMVSGGTAELSGCTFATNSADEGGGLWCTGTLTLEDSAFIEDHAIYRGGAFYLYDCASTVSDCDFVDCDSGDNGGAGYCWLASSSLSNCSFDRNTASFGAALHLRASSPTLEHCTFTANDGGAVHTALNSASILTDCTFWQNLSGSPGSALQLMESTATVERCTFAANQQPPMLWMALSSGSVTNTIIAFTANGGPATSYGGTPDFEHCVVYGNAWGDSLIGTHHDNAFVHPAFCDLVSGDLSLCANSPCLPANNGWGELVGAHDLGCGPCDTAVQFSTWGTIKALFR